MRYKYEGGNLKINLDEELDMNSCKLLRTVIDGYIMRYQPKEFTINLGNVKFMDSSGIGLIIGRYNLIKLLNSKMTILNPTTSVKRLIELSNIGKNIDMRCD
jgi:stage II sporulation protein AA (anti-sigma F factor antagonist)